MNDRANEVELPQPSQATNVDQLKLVPYSDRKDFSPSLA